MDNTDTYDKREVDEVENKVEEVSDVVFDKKLTRSVLWKLDTRFVSEEIQSAGECHE